MLRYTPFSITHNGQTISGEYRLAEGQVHVVSPLGSESRELLARGAPVKLAELMLKDLARRGPRGR